VSLRMTTGHPVTKDVQPVDGNAIRFIAEDGRCMFEVLCGKDGRSLEVRGVELWRVDGHLYGSSIAIYPHASNSVRVEGVAYEPQP
jgi:hypothetical protein